MPESKYAHFFPNLPKEKSTLRTNEAAPLLGFSIRKVRYLIEEGKLPAIKSGEKRTVYQIPLQGMKDFIDKYMTV